MKFVLRVGVCSNPRNSVPEYIQKVQDQLLSCQHDIGTMSNSWQYDVVISFRDLPSSLISSSLVNNYIKPQYYCWDEFGVLLRWIKRHSRKKKCHFPGWEIAGERPLLFGIKFHHSHFECHTAKRGRSAGKSFYDIATYRLMYYVPSKCSHPVPCDRLLFLLVRRCIPTFLLAYNMTHLQGWSSQLLWIEQCFRVQTY